MKRFLITAAGGNGTAMCVLDAPLTRAQYASQGAELGADFERFGAEQAGFLVLPDKHLEMAGGEFCGNATRATAVALYTLTGDRSPTYTVSGFDGIVKADVSRIDASNFRVTAVLPGLKVKTSNAIVRGNIPAEIVDLGGIVHVLIKEPFPDANAYRQWHREIVRELDLDNRDAVGVIWYRPDGGTVRIDPVVWVRAIDSFFYEQSCGSGSIAAGAVCGTPLVVQPTGKTIEAIINDSGVTLESDMEVTREET